MKRWQDITPQEAVDQKLDLSKDLTITAPLNEMGERCPWPWDPQQLVCAPIGQYHCPYCGAMVMAGMEHVDYTGFGDDLPDQYADVQITPSIDDFPV